MRLDDEIPHGIAGLYRPDERAERDRISLTLTQRSSASVIPTRELSSEKAVQCSKKSEAMRVTSIERLLDTKVNLKLWVKVKKDWRDSDFLIKNFGYNKDEI